MACDFRDLKRAAQELVAPWDHQDLNLLDDFKGINPSAEQIALLAYQRLSRLFERRQGIWIDRVTIWENTRCSATYIPDGAER